MKRILSLGLFILMAFALFVNNSVKVEADNEDKIEVTIKAVVDGDNTGVELYNDPVPYGSNLEVDLGVIDKTFAFWIVDGMVDLERDVETTFIATNDFNAIAVFTDEKKLDVYIDHSGELLGTVYEEPEVTVDEPTKIGYYFNSWALIEDNVNVKVHKATYTLNHDQVTINGTSYDYNSIVTLTSDNEEFSHWEVDGKVVSYNKEYTFTALRDQTITEVTEGTVSKDTIVTLTNLNDYREGYSTYLAQIELHNDDELVEYGLEVDGTLRKANNLHKDTNEFLISTKDDWNKVRSYIIVKRDNEFITLFDEELFAVTVEGEGYTSNPETLTGLKKDNQITFTFERTGYILLKVMLDDVVIDVIDNEYILTVTGNHVLTIEWEKIIVLPTIAEVRALSKGTETEFVGVVTGFTDYSEQYSNFDKVFIEDSTAAIVVYQSGFPQDLKVGDRYKVTGKLDSFNGLIQIARGAIVEKLESDIELIAPVEVTDLTEIDESYQGKRVDLEGTVVSVSSTGQELVVKVGENQITVRSNSNSANHTVNSHLLTAVIGQGVNLNGIHVDWFNGAQLLPTTVEQIEFLEISDEMKVADAKEALELPAVATIEGLTLPEAGLHGTVITWASSNEAIIAIDGTVVLPTEETEVTLTATITVGEVTDTKEFSVTVFPEEAVLPVTVEAEFIDHGTNVPAGDITSMFGLDENIFAIHQVNNEAGTNMWMTATELRLYSVRATGEGTELVFEVAEGYKILSIEFTVLATYNPAAEVFVDNVSHNVYSDYGAEILVGELSATTVSIKNVHEGGSKNTQLRIGGIKITYVAVE